MSQTSADYAAAVRPRPAESKEQRDYRIAVEQTVMQPLREKRKTKKRPRPE